MEASFLVCLALMVVSCHAVDKPSWYIGEVILQSPVVTYFGEWFPWEECEPGTYVVGMQLKTEGYRGVWNDDTSLNGVKLHCAAVGFKESNFSIGSAVNQRGSFGNDYHCEGVASGFQLKSEKYQTVFADDTAANNLRLFCNNQRDKFVEGDGERFGDWTAPQECFSKQALCGIQTQVEMEHGNSDETGLNNLNMKCCDVADPAQICTPADNFELLIECDNMEATTPTTCTYQRKIGLAVTRTQQESYYELSELYLNLGFDLNGAIPVLNYNFEFNLAYSEITGHNWTVTNSEVWSEETTTTVSFDVPPKVSTQLLQTVGKCGIYAVSTQRVKRIDTEAGTLKQTITYIDI